MESLVNLALIVISAMLVSNVIFMRFLGICPYLGVSKKIDTSIGMGFAVIFVMTLASIVTFLLQHFVLNKFGLEFLQTIVFILVIASLVQLVEIILKKAVPALYQALGIYLPLITTNCAILGVAILSIQKDYSFIEMIFFSIGSGFGFMLAIVIFAGLREKLEIMEIPESLKGAPIGLITAGLIAMAFMGFVGLVK
ncbi:MAG: RnfABCDGE type electron transport complex subunit A [Pseudomonadota bacterium]